MKDGRKWLEEVSEKCRSIKVFDKKIYFRLPTEEQREPVVAHLKLSEEERKTYNENGAFGWIQMFFNLCVKTAVSSPEFDDFTDEEWTRLLVASRPAGEVFSPILTMSMELCGFPNPEEVVGEEVEDHIVAADKKIGDLPIL